MAPPPPPPLCLPSFGRSKSASDVNSNASPSGSGSRRSSTSLQRSMSQRSSSSVVTLTTVPENLTFKTDSIIYPTPYNLKPSPKDVELRPNLPVRKFSWLSKKAEKRLLIGMSGDDDSAQSVSTLVGSSLERKISDARTPDKPKPDVRQRLTDLRGLMEKEQIDYYVIPSEDAHQSEYVAPNDKRREWVTGFTGSAGTAVVSMNNAYLFTDSRYWAQAERELDPRCWKVMRVGWEGQENWKDYIVNRSKNTKIGIDSRLIAHDVALELYTRLKPRESKLVYPRQNLIDLLWKDKPPRPKDPIYTQSVRFAGQPAAAKLKEIRSWIRSQATAKSESKPLEGNDKPVATLISSLASIAWLLNLRGRDVPFNPVFHSYLFVGLDRTILFIEAVKVNDEVKEYLKELNVTLHDYNEVWTYLRQWKWGEGKVLISPTIPYAVALMLGSARYIIAPPKVDELKAIKNETEIGGLERAYLRDGAAFVKWFAWLEDKFQQGFAITEYEAAYRLTEFRKMGENFMGLAYENISASGPNAALPHYTPTRQGARFIDRETPYLNDSGGQYLDGTCDTTRTVHFGHPTEEQCEAFTRVLQGHIAIDSAVFPEGTTGGQLDVLARRALWKDGLNYLHGTGHGFGAFLNVHEGPQGFGYGNNVPLKPGHVLTNEPGYYNEGEWGVRIESALLVQRVKTKGNFGGDNWLGFRRFTQVPIQTRMVKSSMLSKEEKQWLKKHNQDCLQNLLPYLQDDKRAIKWLRRQAERGLGADAVPGGIFIDWN